jgi:cell division inhibitor SepF
MAKKIMGKFLTMLGFEDREIEEEAPPEREEPTPYSSNAQQRGTQQPNRPAVRRRMEEPPQHTMPKRTEESRVVPMNPQSASNGMRMVVYQPQSYDDTQRIIDDLKSGRPVIANLEDLNVDIAQRVLDFLSGAVYGLDGSIRKISRGIFVLAPSDVDISGNVLGNISGDLRSGRSSYFSLPRRPE